MRDKFSKKPIQATIDKHWPSLQRQGKNDGQLDLFSRSCTISRNNFTERKILIRLAQQDFPIDHLTNRLDQVT